MMSEKQYQKLKELGFVDYGSTEVVYDFVDYIISINTLCDTYKGTVYKVRLKTGEENPIFDFECSNFSDLKQMVKIFEKQYDLKFTTIHK